MRRTKTRTESIKAPKREKKKASYCDGQLSLLLNLPQHLLPQVEKGVHHSTRLEEWEDGGYYI